MKKLSLLLVILSFLGCKKDNGPIYKEVTVDYFYRLSATNLDGSKSYSDVKTMKKIEYVQVNDEGGEEKDYCKEHPDNIRCKSLNITLEYFNVGKDNKDVLLTWKTSYEVDLVKYEVERSLDGLDFKPIKQIKPVGPSIYLTKDDVK